LVERILDERLAQALDGRQPEDPWLDSPAAAEYLGVSRQRIHDLVWAGRLPRSGEKGERLYFRGSPLDALREG
jgi:predicted DNA-binding transcriptional regulator AlpA